MLPRLLLLVVLSCWSLSAEGVLHSFRLWGGSNRDQKLSLYWGWTNGFFFSRGVAILRLADCLEKLPSEQIEAMIDKHYKSHPENWSRPLGEQILEAITIDGGPCESLNPFRQQKETARPQ